MRLRFAIACFGTCGLVACGFTSQEAAEARAASEYRCPAEHTRTTWSNGHTYRVRACASEATYTCINNSRSRMNADWSCVREGAHER